MVMLPDQVRFDMIPSTVLHDPELSSKEKVLYALLLSYAWHNNERFPGYDALARDMGLDVQSVKWILLGLIHHELISKDDQDIYRIKRLTGLASDV
uniref:Putative DNA binding, helix-turn-helix domain containing protein n=1 Tax=viral metagenome TaxID=1070528 RepID=A0A6M3K5L3_9ZZZZ